MNNRQTVCTVANKLAKRLGKSRAFKTAWFVVKGQAVTVKGVSFGNRQTALDRLTKYSREEVSIQLQPGADGAVAVFANVRNRGAYQMGFLSRQNAAIVRLMELVGHGVKVSLGAIVGGYAEGIRYGLRVKLSF